MVLKKQIQLKEQIISKKVYDMRSNWLELKTEVTDKLTSPHTLIWTGISGFVLAEIFHPSKRKLLLGFWPIFSRAAKPLWSKLSDFLQTAEKDHSTNNA
jgi:hypothetical protein